MNLSHIAPCGINCSLCIAYQAQKYNLKTQGFLKGYCSGCIGRGKNCTHSLGRDCGIGDGSIRFCYECSEFPCRRLKAIDKRYRTRYHQSPVETLVALRDKGAEFVVVEQQERWACPKCSCEVCSQNGLCLNCDLDVLKRNKKYRWGEQ